MIDLVRFPLLIATTFRNSWQSTPSCATAWPGWDALVGAFARPLGGLLAGTVVATAAASLTVQRGVVGAIGAFLVQQVFPG